MKQFFYTALCFLFIACSKDENRDTSVGLISFKIQGVPVMIDNSNPNDLPMSKAGVIIYNSPGALVGYQFGALYQTNAASTDLNTKSFNLTVGVNNMVIGQPYTITENNNVVEVQIRNSNFYYFGDNDFDASNFTVTITDHSNNKINGNFSGVLVKRDLDGNDFGTVTISDGKIENLKVIY